MKIIVRGILQKILKYWTIRPSDNCPINPATQCIILKIVGFLERAKGSTTFFSGEVYLTNLEFLRTTGQPMYANNQHKVSR